LSALSEAGCHDFLIQTCRVRTTTALDVAAQFAPAVAVLDIGLPGMDGYELAVALREQPQHAGLRLFALTGYGQADNLKRSLAAGFERHFVKPVALQELVNAMNDNQAGS